MISFDYISLQVLSRDGALSYLPSFHSIIVTNYNLVLLGFYKICSLSHVRSTGDNPSYRRSHTPLPNYSYPLAVTLSKLAIIFKHKSGDAK
jgi:hypothetical protein